MAYDGLMMHNIISKLNDLLIGGKINKIYQISKYEILFLIRSNRQNHKLLISIHPMYARLQLTKLDYPTPEAPNNLTMLFRKHLEGGFIKKIKQFSLDRVCKFTIAAKNELGDTVELYLYLEVMAKHSNLTLTYADNKIIDCLKRISPAMNTARILQPGAIYELPPMTNTRINPLTSDLVPGNNLTKIYQGISPLISNELLFAIDHCQDFKQLIKELITSDSIYLTNDDKKEYFSLIPLSHISGHSVKYPLFTGLDHHFNRIDEKERIKQQTSNLLKFVTDEYKKNHKKLTKLQTTLLESQNAQIERIKGDLLFSNLHLLKKGMTQITLNNFYEANNPPLTIDLDSKLDGKENAKKYYTKYQKAKNSLTALTQQIQLTQEEITYFDSLLTLLQDASYYDALEIKEELENQGYLKKNIKKDPRRKKKKIPAFRRFISKNNSEIAVGKNNIQNDYITFKYASKNDLWFHVKDMPGSHVILKSDLRDEYTIRLAAKIAAFYSKGKNSSSVPVNYCPVKQLKKPAGSKPGMVLLNNYQTIYIDPDDTFLSEIKEIKQ